jgi:site-specific DNA recombinase
MGEKKLDRSKQRDKNTPARVRCAIYTRKSTEEGLDQDFNSLQAQREASQSFIESQKHLGWVPLANRYDDGGFGGGSLDRPALQRLLADIESRRVDCVVVYKVDRLSRSLLDFTRLMDRFEQRSVSFVSITQQFNTTTSLGRLTLNILLSFAQFERELIGERTRDKMAAARRKGKWVGGTPVLGYDVDPRGGRLVVNQKEASRVREIFELYRKHGSLRAVVEELNQRGWSTKSWKSKRGIRHVGRPFSPVSLFRLLTHAIYAGKVEYRGAIYEGEHPPILDSAVWEEVNGDLPKTRPKLKPVRNKHNALLSGLLFCESCQRPMIPTYSGNGSRRYRYYVCQGARQNGWKSCPTKSVSGTLIEDSLVSQLRIRLSADHTRLALKITERDWQAFIQGHTKDLVTKTVDKLRYNGTAGRVSVELRTRKNSDLQP